MSANNHVHAHATIACTPKFDQYTHFVIFPSVRGLPHASHYGKRGLFAVYRNAEWIEAVTTLKIGRDLRDTSLLANTLWGGPEVVREHFRTSAYERAEDIR